MGGAHTHAARNINIVEFFYGGGAGDHDYNAGTCCAREQLHTCHTSNWACSESVKYIIVQRGALWSRPCRGLTLDGDAGGGGCVASYAHLFRGMFDIPLQKLCISRYIMLVVTCAIRPM